MRSKIYQSTYRKEQCFGLTDKAMELEHTGGNRKPAPFLCLALKMLQIQLDKDIVVEFIKNEGYKYLRVLGAFYLRLTGTVADVYQYLEPLYNDCRKIRHKLSHANVWDEFIDELLTKDYSCDTALPRIQKKKLHKFMFMDLFNRRVLEVSGTLEPRRSALEDDFEEDKEDGQPMDVDEPNGREKDHYRGRSPTTEQDWERDRKHERHRSGYNQDRDRERDRDGRERERRDRDRGRHRSRSRSRNRRERALKMGEYRRRRGRGSASPPGRAEDGGPREEPKKRKEKKEKKETLRFQMIQRL